MIYIRLIIDLHGIKIESRIPKIELTEATEEIMFHLVYVFG
jgi:hypothetical protein